MHQQTNSSHLTHAHTLTLTLLLTTIASIITSCDYIYSVPKKEKVITSCEGTGACSSGYTCVLNKDCRAYSPPICADIKDEAIVKQNATGITKTTNKTICSAYAKGDQCDFKYLQVTPCYPDATTCDGGCAVCDCPPVDPNDPKSPPKEDCLGYDLVWGGCNPLLCTPGTKRSCADCLDDCTKNLGVKLTPDLSTTLCAKVPDTKGVLNYQCAAAKDSTCASGYLDADGDLTTTFIEHNNGCECIIAKVTQGQGEEAKELSPACSIVDDNGVNNTLVSIQLTACDNEINQRALKGEYQDNPLEGMHKYYLDADKDGHGNINPSSVILCGNGTTTVIVGDKQYSKLNDDCLDSNNRVYTGAPELCDGIINDCNSWNINASGTERYKPAVGSIEADDDLDGYIVCTKFSNTIPAIQYGTNPAISGGKDCMPNDPDINPGKEEGMNCSEKDGWYCDGKKICESNCGDNLKANDEDCDLGSVGGLGCTAECKVEENFVCRNNGAANQCFLQCGIDDKFAYDWIDSIELSIIGDNQADGVNKVVNIEYIGDWYYHQDFYSVFSRGNEVLLYTQYRSTIYTSCQELSVGQWELNYVESVEDGKLHLLYPLKNNYNAQAGVIHRLVRVPSFNVVDLSNNAFISAPFWDDLCGGGILVFRTKVLNFSENASINMDQQGFWGGCGGDHIYPFSPDGQVLTGGGNGGSGGNYSCEGIGGVGDEDTGYDPTNARGGGGGNAGGNTSSPLYGGTCGGGGGGGPGNGGAALGGIGSGYGGRGANASYYENICDAQQTVSREGGGGGGCPVTPTRICEDTNFLAPLLIGTGSAGGASGGCAISNRNREQHYTCGGDLTGSSTCLASNNIRVSGHQGEPGGGIIIILANQINIASEKTAYISSKGGKGGDGGQGASYNSYTPVGYAGGGGGGGGMGAQGGTVILIGEISSDSGDLIIDIAGGPGGAGGKGGDGTCGNTCSEIAAGGAGGTSTSIVGGNGADGFICAGSTGYCGGGGGGGRYGGAGSTGAYYYSGNNLPKSAGEVTGTSISNIMDFSAFMCP